MNLYIDAIMPGAWIAVALWNWYLAYYRGWAQVLPAFTRYLVFTAVSFIVLLVSYRSTFSSGTGSIACLIYSYGYYLSGFLSIVLFLAFFYELLRKTMPGHPEVRRGVTAVLAACVVVFSLAGALMCLGSAAWHLPRLEPFGNLALRLQTLTLLALYLRLLVIKGKFRLRLGRTMSLLVLGPVPGFLADPVLSYVDFRYGRQTAFSLVTRQAINLLWMVMWWVALRKDSETISRAAAAPA